MVVVVQRRMRLRLLVVVVGLTHHMRWTRGWHDRHLHMVRLMEMRAWKTPELLLLLLLLRRQLVLRVLLQVVRVVRQ